jgi:hypothetical protein
MWIRLIILTSLCSWAGCLSIESITPEVVNNPDGSTQQDMVSPPPKCTAPAANGLTGDNLVCVNFSSISDQVLGSQPLPQQLNGWSFNNPPNCWQVASGQLQIMNFGGFGSTCGLTLPPIDLKQSQDSQYNSITLSLVQTVDLDPGTSTPNQYAEVYLGTANPASLVTQMTNTSIEQQMTVTINKQKLPAALNNVYQWLLQVSSFQANNTKKGWQISSVAVMGNQ